MASPKRRKLSLKRNTKQPQTLDSKETCISKRDVSAGEEEWSHETGDFRYCGLVNIGNTCYISAVVQALRFSPQLTDALVSTSYSGDIEANERIVPMVIEFLKLLSIMQERERAKEQVMKVNPSALVKSIRDSYTLFEQKTQHDTQEFLQCILSEVEASTRLHYSKPKHSSQSITSFFKPSLSPKPSTVDTRLSVISKFFEGTLVFETKCLICEASSNRREDFFNITVPVLSSDLSRRCGPISLHWALSQVASVDRLTSDNKYWCDNCYHLTEGKRSALLTRLPPIMIIHLNRFSTAVSSNVSAMQIHKACGNIAIPMCLSFKQWTTPTCLNSSSIYQLYAVILHTGASCNSGHYTTIVRSCYAGGDTDNSIMWVLFDDDKVSLISSFHVSELLSPLSTSDCTPYILFYSCKFMH